MSKERKKILQIASTVNSGSVGRIAAQIGDQILQEDWDSYIGYGRTNLGSKSQVIKVGNDIDMLHHGLMTRLFDRHGFASIDATKKFIKEIDYINPDIIHLHHLHGYFINIKVLFEYLKKLNKPIVWTFHDCWSFTGHCAYFDYVCCEKWKTACNSCPQKESYPKSILLDRSKENFMEKKKLFTSVSNMTIVPVSNWMGTLVEQSFLNKYPIKVIHNGVDINDFRPYQDSRQDILRNYNLHSNSFLILGVASVWEHRKGLDYFLQLADVLDESFKIILVGLTKLQKERLPKNIIGIERTESLTELAKLYSGADVFVNPTLEDNFPSTNLEALACGTPVITFNTGGSVESVCEHTGKIVPKGNVSALVESLKSIKKQKKEYFSYKCRNKAELLYNKIDRFKDYINLYKNLLNEY